MENVLVISRSSKRSRLRRYLGIFIAWVRAAYVRSLVKEGLMVDPLVPADESGRVRLIARF